MAKPSDDWAALLSAVQSRSGLAGGGKVSLKDLQKFAKSQSNLYGSYGSGGKSALEEIGSSLKNLGVIGLNTLSVPQAMLFTAGSKMTDFLTGGKMKSTMGWDEMLGGFSPNYHGYKEILEQVGVPKDSAFSTWGGLAGDIALDPLWFAAPAKLARTPGQAAKVIDATSKTVDAARIAAGVSKDAGTTAMLSKFAKTPAEQYAERVRLAGQVSPDAGTTALLKKFAKSSPKPPPVQTGADIASALKSKKVQLRVEGGGLGINAADQMAGTTKGTQIGDFFIHTVAPRSRSKGGKPAEVKIYRLAQPGRLHSEDVTISETFRSQREAEKWLRNRINEVGGTGPEVEPKMVNLGPNGAPNLHDVGAAMNAHKASVIEQFNGQKNVLGLKFGVGKANPEGGRGLTGSNFTVRTKIPLRAAPSLGAIGGADKVSGFFKRGPFAKGVNQMARSAREMQAAARQEQSVTARAMSGLSDDQAKLVTFAAGLDNVSRPGIEGEVLLGSEGFVPQLRAAGHWNKDMDLALKYAQGRMGAFREMHGISEKTYRKLSPDAAKFQREVEDFVTKMKDEGMESAVITRKMEKMIREAVKERRITKAEAKSILGKGGDRGPYLKQMLDKPSKDAKIEERGLLGFIGSKLPSGGGRDVARKHESLLNYYTKDEWSAELQRLGIEPGHADELAEQMGAELKRLEDAYYPNKEGQVAFSTEEIASKPETDLFKILGESDAKAIHRELMYSIDSLAVEAGFAVKKKNGKLLFKSDAAKREYDAAVKSLTAGEMARNKGWQKYMRFVSYLKMTITSLQPQHYWGNATGDYTKVLVEGNLRHWVPPTAVFQLTGTLGGRATKGSRFAKLVSGDIEVMNAPFMKIGGREYSGAEVLWMSHMIGLGKGFAGAEIAELSRLFEKSEGLFGVRHLKAFAKWSARQNHVREDAVRIQTWIKHMESGDDPMTAGLKTIRAHFDYNDMTDFEKNVMRQVILFYTWTRKNVPFQVKAMGQKPGLYSAYGDIERDRPKMPGEPEYISNLGLIPIPGFGAINVAAPWADLNKIPSTLTGGRDSFRQNVLGALAPGLKQAVEIGTGVNTLTGGKLDKGGAPGNIAGFEVPAWLEYFAKQYNPYTTQVGRIAKTTSDPRDIIGLLGNLTGTVRRVQPDPEWQKRQAKDAAKRHQEKP